jgi:hypothetical protein
VRPLGWVWELVWIFGCSAVLVGLAFYAASKYP